MDKYQEIIDLAFKARENAYAPYSNFKVGACILCKDGTTFLGANIENASFGATNCAERSAVFAAYSNGYRLGDFEALAIVTEADNITAPCGICRQVMREFCQPEEFMIILSDGKNGVIEKSLEELLPLSFGPENLK